MRYVGIYEIPKYKFEKLLKEGLGFPTDFSLNDLQIKFEHKDVIAIKGMSSVHDKLEKGYRIPKYNI